VFVFGHVGLTWGGALLLTRLTRRRQPFGAGVDFRLVIVGSMLPDIIDKPLGVFVLSDELGTGRAFAHSLAFVAAIALGALLRSGASRRALAAVALGAAAHLVFDRMWTQPESLLWPLLGWRLEREDVSGWLEQMLEQLFSDPYTYVSEAAGAAIVVVLLVSLIRARGLRDFFLYGRMAPSGAGRPRGGLAAGQERPQEL
jgi:hypothetical protein